MKSEEGLDASHGRLNALMSLVEEEGVGSKRKKVFADVCVCVCVCVWVCVCVCVCVCVW